MNAAAWIAMAFFAMIVIVVISGMIYDFKVTTAKKGTPPPPEPAPPSSLSLLAGLSFFSGVGAILLTTVTGILTLTMSMDDLFPITETTRRQLDLAARIVLYLSLLPAVGAVAFALAARGVIAESRGAVRGRPLYRTGVLLAIVSAVVVFDAKILNPATWTAAAFDISRGDGAGDDSGVDRGYLGVEHGSLDDRACISLRRVVPGSPAERAGLKVGDLVEKVDGTSVYQLPPLGTPGVQSYSPGSTVNYLGGYIGSLKPGSKVTLSIRRGSESLNLVAELSATFDSLLKILEAQGLDDERLAVLKAAGAERRYSADELRRICGTFDLDNNRMKMIETALPKLQDPQNGYQILGSLDLPASKRKVSEWIEAALKPK